MTKYWFISMAIPGECFANENRIGVAPKTKKEWKAPELKKIDVEQITAHIFKVGDDSESDS